MIRLWITVVMALAGFLLAYSGVRRIRRTSGPRRTSKALRLAHSPGCLETLTPVPVILNEHQGGTEVVAHLCPDCLQPVQPPPRPPRGPGAVVTGPQPPATGGIRFGGDRQATYWWDANNPSPIRAYVARLNDGTTRTFTTAEEAQAWILSTAPGPSLPDPGKSLHH